jgi:hypothetical protein
MNIMHHKPCPLTRKQILTLDIVHCSLIIIFNENTYDHVHTAVATYITLIWFKDVHSDT